jgi:hypothetical protein
VFTINVANRPSTKINVRAGTLGDTDELIEGLMDGLKLAEGD